MSSGLVKGAHVRIIENENTLQRTPQYIGRIGIVKEAPVHPATWFKIRFDDGEVCTFRPSAFILVDEDGMPSKDVRPKTSSAEAMRAKATAALAASAEAGLIPGVQSRGVPSVYLLMDLEADLWVGAIVRVIAGKFTGVEGVVLRSGNGWVQIETNMFGEIAKRAHELEVLRAGPPQHHQAQPQGVDVFGAHPATHMNAAMQMKRTRTEMENAMYDGVREDYSSGGMRAPMRMVAPRPRPSSPSEDGLMGGPGMHWPMRQSVMSGPMGMGAPGLGSMPPASAYPVPMMSASARASPGMMPTSSVQQQQHLQQQPHAAAASPQAPLIHPNLKEAQYQYMQKYLKKMKEKFKSRPDMRFWSNVLRSSHLMSGGEPDPYLDAHMAREFNDAVCPSCLCERWPLSKYCWNESCPASPVYWKLTGRPPVPPQFGPAAAPAELQAPPDGPIVDIGNYSHLLSSRRHQAPPKPNRVVDMYMNQPGIVLPTDPPAGAADRQQDKVDAGAAYNPHGGPLNESARRALYSQALDPPTKICGDNWGPDAGNCQGNDSSSRVKADPDAESLESCDNSSGILTAGADAIKGDDTAVALADMKNSVEPSNAVALPMESSSSVGAAPVHSQAPPQSMHQGGGGIYMDNSSGSMGKYGLPSGYAMASRGGFIYGQGSGGMYHGGMGLPGGAGPMPGGMYGGGGPSGPHFMVSPSMGEFTGMGQGFPPQQGRFPGGAMMNPATAAALNRAAAMGGSHIGMNGQINGSNASIQSQFYGRNQQQQLPFYGAPPGAMLHMSSGFGGPPGSMNGGGNMRLPPQYMHHQQQQQQSQSNHMPQSTMMQGPHPGMMGGPGTVSSYGSGGSPSAAASSLQQQMQHEQQQMHGGQSAQRESTGGGN